MTKDDAEMTLAFLDATEALLRAHDPDDVQLRTLDVRTRMVRLRAACRAVLDGTTDLFAGGT